MKVRYKIELDVETDDYVKTLGEINDVLQDGFKEDFPEIRYVAIAVLRSP